MPWLSVPDDCDAVINFWLAKDIYGAGRYDDFYHAFADWVKQSWPFTNIYFSNLLKTN